MCTFTDGLWPEVGGGSARGGKSQWVVALSSADGSGGPAFHCEVLQAHGETDGLIGIHDAENHGEACDVHAGKFAVEKQVLQGVVVL